MQLTIERVKQVVDYNPETGEFVWRQSRRGVRPGQRAGCVRAGGYLLLTIDMQRILAHRLAIFYTTGYWPAGNVDHIDGDPSNNRLSNLRDVSQQINVQNIKSATKRNKSSGMLGVSYHKRDKLWRARIYVNGITKTWYSKDKDEAQRMYLDAKRLLHSGCSI